ncbi:MAG: hypothetical protein AB1480_18125 [Nitrospirota bacterium]
MPIAFQYLLVSIPSSLFFASILAAVLGITIDRIVYLPLRNQKAPNPTSSL